MGGLRPGGPESICNQADHIFHKERVMVNMQVSARKWVEPVVATRGKPGQPAVATRSGI